jgi:5-methylcytosine-specific restriction endonuclease McrA
VIPAESSSSWSRARRAFPAATRKRILRRDGYECQLRAPGCLIEATIADHVVPHAEGGTDDESNGQAACARCHDTKTRAEIARGRVRMPRRARAAANEKKHPGLL